MKTSALGSHFILDMHGCSHDVLDDLLFLQKAMLEALTASGATIINDTFHKFSPQGVTGVVVIAESHASVHTWPELGFAAFDFFTCGVNMNARKAIDHLIRELKPVSHTIREIERGAGLQA